MSKRRANGEGNLRKRKDGRWEGRIVVGHKQNGEPIFRYVLAKTQKELLDKLHRDLEAFQDVELTEDSRMTLGEWLDRWMEDYGAAMSHAVEHFKAQGVTCFIFGDIFLHDVRKYRERQLAPHGIGVAEPLWGESSGGVMHDFLASGLRTVIVTTMADSLGADAVGREIDPAFMASLPAGVDPNGENGEYHTFCYDGPIFRTPVPFRLGTPLRRSYRIRLDDGSEKSYSYWFADLQQA